MQAPDTHLLYTLGEPVALHDAVHKAAEENKTDLYAAPVALWRLVVPTGLFQAKCPIRKLSPAAFDATKTSGDVAYHRAQHFQAAMTVQALEKQAKRDKETIEELRRKLAMYEKGPMQL